jgi:hypothetical protein
MRMQRDRICLSVLLVLIGSALTSFAQRGSSETVPSTLKFAGTLTESHGKPFRGVMGVNFYLYQEKQGGAPLWMETQNIRLDKDGHYSVMLGSTHALPAEVFASDGARWLSVQASGQAEQPRTLLFSLPYGGPAMASMNQTHVEDAGDSQASPVLPPNVHGNGVVNFIPVWTATNIIGESVIKQSGSNVGIGTTAPATTLDVFSSIAGIHAPIAQFGSRGTTDSNSILTYNGRGATEMFEVGCVNCFVPGSLVGDGGLRVSRGTHILFGDSGASRLILDGSGNADQPRTGGGMVKAMIFFSPNNGGKIISCFNSTLFGAAATKPPCGFGFDITGVGDYVFFLGFQVDDRFVSLTGAAPGFVAPLSVCNDIVGTCGHIVNNQQLEVFSVVNGFFEDQKLYLLVY